MASGSELELTLLKKRFPEVGVHQCGRLHSGVCSDVSEPSPHYVVCSFFHSPSLHLPLTPTPPTFLSIDFFCARTISGCLYEGRLFVTDKALLFVST